MKRAVILVLLLSVSVAAMALFRVAEGADVGVPARESAPAEAAAGTDFGFSGGSQDPFADSNW